MHGVKVAHAKTFGYRAIARLDGRLEAYAPSKIAPILIEGRSPKLIGKRSYVDADEQNDAANSIKFRRAVGLIACVSFPCAKERFLASSLA